MSKQCTVTLMISVLAVQRSLPSVSDRHIYIHYIYLHTLAQIRPPMLQDYSPHAKALSNNLSLPLHADATVTFNETEITVSEDDADIEVCLSIFNIPVEGIDSTCVIEVTLNFTEITTSKFTLPGPACCHCKFSVN